MEFGKPIEDAPVTLALWGGHKYRDARKSTPYTGRGLNILGYEARESRKDDDIKAVNVDAMPDDVRSHNAARPRAGISFTGLRLQLVHSGNHVGDIDAAVKHFYEEFAVLW
jgi:hypothetical protein